MKKHKHAPADIKLKLDTTTIRLLKRDAFREVRGADSAGICHSDACGGSNQRTCRIC
jgi:hypothetical protein